MCRRSGSTPSTASSSWAPWCSCSSPASAANEPADRQSDHRTTQLSQRRQRNKTMDLGLTGKTAYVTGTAMGIGQDIVRMLAAEGVTVFAVDLDGEALNSYVSEENLSSVTTFVQDLSTLAGCRTAAKA